MSLARILWVDDEIESLQSVWSEIDPSSNLSE